MKVIISFVTLISQKMDFNQKIEFLSQFEIDGVEIFGQELATAGLVDSTISILEGYNENSVHMPNTGVYDSSQSCKETIEQITKKAKEVKAEKLIYHSHQIQDYKYVFQSGFVSAIENAPDGKKKKGLQTVEENRVLLEKYHGLKLVLDPTHALVNSILPKDFLALKEYIIGVHLSGISQIGGSSTDHLLLTQTPENILREIRPLLDLNVPFVIESKIPYIDCRKEIQQEIDFVKEKFHLR